MLSGYLATFRLEHGDPMSEHGYGNSGFRQHEFGRSSAQSYRSPMAERIAQAIEEQLARNEELVKRRAEWRSEEEARIRARKMMCAVHEALFVAVDELTAKGISVTMNECLTSDRIELKARGSVAAVERNGAEVLLVLGRDSHRVEFSSADEVPGIAESLAQQMAVYLIAVP